MLKADRDKLAGAFRLGAIGAGILLWAGMIWSISANHSAKREAARQYAQQYAQDADKRVAKLCLDRNPQAYAQCVTKIIDATREGQRAEYDLSAQEEMADWTLAMIFLSGGALIISGVGLTALLRTIRQGDEALGHARRSAKTEQRAWIKFEIEPRFGLKAYSDSQRRFAFKGRLLNIGNTPAIHVNYFAWLCFDKPKVRLAKEIEISKREPLAWDGTAILPDDEHLLNFTANVDEAERVEAGLGKGGYPDGSLVFVIMLAQYQTVYDTIFHHTAVVYRLTQEGTLVDAIDFSAGYIPEGNLVLKRYEEGLTYLD